MTIFGFYLKLEEKAWNRLVALSASMFYVYWILKKFLTKTKGYFLSKNETLYIVFFRIKRKRKKEKLEKILTSEWIKSHSKEDLTDVSLSFKPNVQKIFSNLDWHYILLFFHYKIWCTFHNVMYPKYLKRKSQTSVQSAFDLIIFISNI